MSDTTIKTPIRTVRTVRTVDDLRFQIATWRASGETIALVPTMGALHAGHMALIARAQSMASKVCVTLFVNPTQFGENEDLSTYPRHEEGDRDMLSNAGVDLLYAPNVDQMYGPGDVTRINVPGLGDILEGASRPGFFTGVATVVCKLLLQALPDFALFGEKDYQQLQIIKRMVLDLNIPVSIEGCACVREENGLALSSRNAYLSEPERLIAPLLHEIMFEMNNAIRSGGAIQTTIDAAKTSLLEAGFTDIDYLVVTRADTLSDIKDFADLEGAPGRIIAAVWLGKTRLIDNILL